MNPTVFREYDVRGLVGRDLNDNFVFELGQAIGTHALKNGAKKMALGRDCRISSSSFAASIKAGLVATGIHVVDIGLCATPILYFSIRSLHTDGGVMVTGSHNPPEFNGFKICIGADAIYGDEIQELYRLMENGDYISDRGTTEHLDMTLAYQDYIFSNVKVMQGLRIAIDAGNGVGGFFSEPIFRKCGSIIHPLYFEIDGRFPNHFPDPTMPENLSELISIVKSEGCDVGIAFDGDADRIGVVNDRGDILYGDEILLLFARFVLQDNPNASIIGEVKCSQKLFDDIKAHGGRPIMWKAGHSLIKAKMKEEHALLAGEMSGHMFFADRYFGFDDAIYTAFRLLEILSKTGRKLSDILSDVPRSHSTPEIRLDCPDAIKFHVIDELKDYFRKRYDIIDIDGVRIPFNNGWGLVRASNTQPVLVLRFEANTEYGLHEIRSLIEEVLKGIMKKFS